MPRDLPLGNGGLLVAFDGDYRLRELCYPHIGSENHLSGAICRFGIMVDGQFSWIERGGGWQIQLGYEANTMVTQVECRHDGLGLELRCADCVDFHEALYLRQVTVVNRKPQARSVRLFFHQDFAIGGSDVGDTAAYDPAARAVVHYKGPRYFLINLQVGKTAGVANWAVGQKNQPGREGTFRDAEDGELGRNTIAQGAVDSVVAADCPVDAGGTVELFYWIAAGPCWDGSWDAVRALDAKIVARGPETFLHRTRDYWRLWVNESSLAVADLPDGVAALYARSLLILRTQIDHDGAIIAANDSDILSFSRDTYAYCWPRDGALVAHALDLAGHPQPALKFYDFCANRLTEQGYLLHKYTAEGDLGSSWHPWMIPAPTGTGCDQASASAVGAAAAPIGYEVQLPIQEDETALVVWGLWQHFERWRNVESVKGLYGRLVKKSARFMASYRDPTTRLPGPSYDLWEERRGICTFTCGAVVGGLRAAAGFARAFGEDALATDYTQAADEIRQAMDRYLYRSELGRFVRMITVGGDGTILLDPVLDASVYGAFAFGAYPADDPRVLSTMRAVQDGLTVRTAVGGVARYSGDSYHQVAKNLAHVPGNPWFICTLWLAQHAIACARSADDLQPARDILAWVLSHALPSGVLAEQLDPLTGAPLSVSPLTWSHAALVTTVANYRRRLFELRGGSPQQG